MGKLKASIIFLCFFLVCGYYGKETNEDLTGNGNIQISLDNLEENLLKKFEIDPHDLHQSGTHHVKIPKYIEKLYGVMSENEKIGKEAGDARIKDVTTIHMYKPTGKIHRDRIVMYQLKPEVLVKNTLTKAELVLENKWPELPFDLKMFCIKDDTWKVTKSKHKEEEIIADVTQCLQLNNHPVINVIFKIIAFPLKNGNNLISLRRIRHMHPILVTFHNFNTALENSLESRTKRATFSSRLAPYDVGITREEVTWERAKEIDACRLKPWFLNFIDIGFHWIIAPTGYSPNVCVGGCPAVFLESYLNATNYSFLKNLFHVKQRFLNNSDSRVSEVPEAYCAPTLYTSQTVLYMERNERIVLKQIPEMRAISCGCR